MAAKTAKETDQKIWWASGFTFLLGTPASLSIEDQEVRDACEDMAGDNDDGIVSLAYPELALVSADLSEGVMCIYSEKQKEYPPLFEVPLKDRYSAETRYLGRHSTPRGLLVGKIDWLSISTSKMAAYFGTLGGKIATRVVNRSMRRNSKEIRIRPSGEVADILKRASPLGAEVLPETDGDRRRINLDAAITGNAGKPLKNGIVIYSLDDLQSSKSPSIFK